MKTSLSKLTAFALCILLITGKFIHLNVYSGGKPKVITWDMFGYYLYLPAVFIHHDLAMKDISWIEKARDEMVPGMYLYQIRPGEDARTLDIYQVGTAIVFMPAFLMARLLAGEGDGFSLPYNWALVITGMIFVVLGVVSLRKLLTHFFHERLTSFLLVVIILGTNYLVQAGMEPESPHSLLFTLNCLVLLFTLKLHRDYEEKYFYILAALLALTFLIRPTSLIFAVVPVLWNVRGVKSFIEKIRLVVSLRLKHLLLAVLLFLGIASLQFVYQYYATGDFWKINYHSETLAFSDPYTWEFLFSFKKGWLVYTPVMIFAIAGFYCLYRHKRELFLPFVIFFAVNVWVLSSWENWWYAGSFGQRPMVDSYALMAVPMGFFLYAFDGKRFVKYFFHFLFLLLTVFSLFQSWQYSENIISHEQMTKEYYSRTFLKTAVTAEDRQYLEVDRNFNPENDVFQENPSDYTVKTLFSYDFEKREGAPAENFSDSVNSNTTSSLLLNKKVEFSPGFSETWKNLTDKDYFWIRGSVDYFSNDSVTGESLMMTVSLENKYGTYYYIAKQVKPEAHKPGAWCTLKLDLITPFLRHRDDLLKIYCWTRTGREVYIDNFRAEFWEPKVVYN